MAPSSAGERPHFYYRRSRISKEIGDHETAAVLYGTTPVARNIMLDGVAGVSEFFAPLEAGLREHLGDERFAEAVARGRSIDDDQAVELARRELTKLTFTPSRLRVGQFAKTLRAHRFGRRPGGAL